MAWRTNLAFLLFLGFPQGLTSLLMSTLMRPCCRAHRESCPAKVHTKCVSYTVAELEVVHARGVKHACCICCRGVCHFIRVCVSLSLCARACCVSLSVCLSVRARVCACVQLCMGMYAAQTHKSTRVCTRMHTHARVRARTHTLLFCICLSR